MIDPLLSSILSRLTKRYVPSCTNISVVAVGIGTGAIILHNIAGSVVRISRECMG